MENDTNLVQNMLTSGVSVVILPAQTFVVDTLTVPNYVRRIEGGATLQQRTLGVPILNVTNSPGLVIRDLSFTGVAGTIAQVGASAQGNSAVVAATSSRLKIRDCDFRDFQYHVLQVQGCTDVEISGNHVENVTHGILFSGVTRGKIASNTLLNPQMPGLFTTAIALDSTDGHGFGVCADVSITGNTVRSYANAQAILVHAGRNIIVANNILDDVLQGISVNPYNDADVIDGIIITGNVYTGTTTPGAAPGVGNFGISVGGSPTAKPANVVVASNVVTNANAVIQRYSMGGIGIGYASQVVVVGNVCTSCYGEGISIANGVTSLVVRGNLLANAIAVPDTTRAGLYIVNGLHTGVIRGNVIDGALWGIRADSSSPGLLVGDNDFFNCTETIHA